MIVDRETGLLLRLTQYEDDPGYWTSIETIRNLELDTPTSPADFTLPVPAGTRVIDHDYGYAPLTRSEAASLLRVPAAPADRHRRAPLATLAGAKKPSLAFLPDMQAPVYRDAVTARYGSGLDAIVVLSRRGSPVEVAPELTARTITIGRGPLTGLKPTSASHRAPPATCAPTSRTS